MCQNAFILGQYSKCEQNFYQKEHHPDKVGVGGSSPLAPTIVPQSGTFFIVGGKVQACLQTEIDSNKKIQWRKPLLAGASGENR